MIKKIKRKNIGSTFDSFLQEEGILEECKQAAIKSIIASQLRAILQKEGVSQAELARKMKTSKAAVNRLLDPNNPAITFNTLTRASLALNKEVFIKIK